MFFKKSISPDQLQFAIIISAVNLYRKRGDMPNFHEIEDQVLSLVKEFGGKLNSQQMQAIKLAATRLSFSDAELLVEKMAKSAEGLDEKDALKLSDLLAGSGVHFC